MPAMPVYKDSPSNLKNQIFESDGSNLINVKADTTGRLKIVTDTTNSLAVVVSEANDSIAVYGSDGTTNRILRTNTTVSINKNNSKYAK